MGLSKETDTERRNYVQILYLAHGLGQPAYLSDSISKIIEKEKDAPKKFTNAIKLLLLQSEFIPNHCRFSKDDTGAGEG